MYSLPLAAKALALNMLLLLPLQGFAQHLTWDALAENDQVDHVNGVWDVGTTPNWTEDAGNTNVMWPNIEPRANAIFGLGAATGTAIVTVNGAPAPGDVTINQATNFQAQTNTATDSINLNGTFTVVSGITAQIGYRTGGNADQIFGGPSLGTGSIVVNNGASTAISRLRVYASAAADTPLANISSLTVNNNGRLFLGRGTYDPSIFTLNPGSTVTINAGVDGGVRDNAGHATRLETSTGAAGTLFIGNGVTLDQSANSQDNGTLRGNITIGDGGTLILKKSNGDGISRMEGALRLLDGSTHQFTNANRGDARVTSQELLLGDGNPNTNSRITIQNTSTNANDIGHMKMMSTNAPVDDGNVTLVYRINSTSENGRFGIGWNHGGAITSSSSNTGVNQPFRGGSAGTEFEMGHNGQILRAIGGLGGVVFTASSPTELSTGGTVAFHNAGANQSGVLSHGALGSVAIGTGGSFVISNAAGVVQATSVEVNAGHIGGIGTFDAAVTINAGGAISPGLSVGTLNTGDLTLAGTYRVDLAGDDSNDFINVTGAAVLDASTGIVDVSLLVGYAPETPMQFWTILTASEGITGAALPTNDPDYFTRFNSGQTSLELVYVPEPGSALLLLLGAVTLALRRPHRRS